jgi:predicted metal-dependent hydrolase
MNSDQQSLFDDFFANCVDESKSEISKKSKNKFDYEIRRSKRRKQSVGAYREQGKTIIVAPVRMPVKEVHLYAEELVAELNAHDEKISSAEILNERASYLVQTYLDVDVLNDYPVPVQIRWVTNQNTRWGSCTPGDGNIRISHRIQGMPQYVIDAVLLHELIHLLVEDHSPKFYSYLDKFTDYKLAKEYLAGYSFAQQNLFID